MNKNRDNGLSLKIVIVNTHSILNSGDAGIIIAQIQFLRKHFLNAKIVVSSRTPGLDSSLFKSYDVTLLPPVIPTPGIILPRSQKMGGYLKKLLSFRPGIRLFREIMKCNLVISNGGGYFYSNRRLFPGPMFIQNYFHILLTIFFRKPLFFFPQSFGPFHNRATTILMKHILKAGVIKKIWCREAISFELVSGLIPNRRSILGICPDMAFYLDLKNGYESKPVFPDRSGPVVALTLRSWSFPELKNKESRRQKREQYLNSLIEVCKDICNYFDGSLIFITQSRGLGRLENDREITKEIIHRLKEFIAEDRICYPEIEDDASPLHVASLLSTVDLVIATRFHSAIFALLSGVPVISISYQHKSEGIMRSLGMEQFCLPISHLKSEDVLLLIKDTAVTPYFINECLYSVDIVE